ncbi:MAG: 4Fe-4S binding protein [Nitrospirae bacterium]|nr:4Fe-4S binding protein [Nitrospirota bacterium]
MKKIVAVIIFCLFAAGSNAIGSEGHGTSSGQQEFRIDKAKARLSIVPESFVSGKTPEVVIELTDVMSGNPMLDAGIYIFLEKASGQPPHSGHNMSDMSVAGPAPSQLSHAGHDMNAMTKGSTSSEAGLDFGESAQSDMSVDLSTFVKAEPQQKAGSYAAVYPILEKGDYTYTIAITSLGGKKFKEPLVYGGTLPYHEASKAAFYRMAAVMSLILFCGIAAVWIIAQRKAAKISAGQKLNILDIPWIKKFFKSAWFQPVFQIPVLLFFILIIIAGLFDIQQGDRNIATILMWTIWWAAIIFTFVFVGRVWCMMCPFGAIQDWLGRLFSLNRDFPKPVRNIWLSSFIFFGLTWWDSFSGIVNKPSLTAFLLLGFFGVAMSMSVVFKGRSFCRYVCPIGGLIGLYSMFSPVELRNRCMDVCREHKVKECIKGTDKSNPCPMFVTPMTLDRNNYCNFCSECVKSCSQDNIVIRFRSFAKDLWISSKGYIDEAFLALVLVGMTIIVTGEMIEPWHHWMDVVSKMLPFDTLGITSHIIREKATFLVVMTTGSLFIPLLLLGLTSLIVRKTTGPDSPLGLKDAVIQFAYMFIPVGLSMHLAHNISHMFKEGPGIIPAFQRLANEYTGLNLGTPDWNVTPLMGNEAIFWLQMLILAILNIFSLYAGYRIAVRYYGDKALRAFIPMAALAVFFMLINTFILGQPMAMRHTH